MNFQTIDFIFLFIFLCFKFVSSNLVCRNCGHTVSSASDLINVNSEKALYNYTMSVLNKPTLVQVVRNPASEAFHIITTKNADLKMSGGSYYEDSWFPSHRWTACTCSKCGSHIGWYFESPKQRFVALVLDYLISSDYTDTLTVVVRP